MITSFFLEKSFLVTGASSGIGKALVLELNRNGAVVGAVARRRELIWRPIRSSKSFFAYFLNHPII
ncbi:SDR family NAD(P)-dependent oxidoreductase [Leptospira borgpetersenii serovar Hardjo-bovis]|nr:SDR family NAD(P)-dependent oxidoreductase [Leptospira borgpetersenii serovar Hardjo-bovis]TQE51080.1 SDR family NAD(P)-dependent oxidoreductase [Leptospira borgpetersenii]TQE52920.1 SDR family NAD(P)-dependent oxidoreductase [Leptospira borgpetersenii]